MVTAKARTASSLFQRSLISPGMLRSGFDGKVIDHDAMTGLQFPTVGIAVAGTARIFVLPALDLESVKHRGVIVAIRM